MKSIIVFLFSLVIGFAIQPQDDLVDPTYLKTINMDIEEQVYSGYLPVTLNGKALPVTLWLNGGPGCSSAQGLFNENGPVSFVHETAKLLKNPYSWSNYSNMLYLESPVGVGFSYGPSQNQSDATTAAYNLQAIISFFDRFSDLKGNKFFISGESYAGIYIPTLASNILDYNAKQSKDLINLQGLLIGNGCTDPTECTDQSESFGTHYFDFLGQQNLISESTYQKAKKNYVQCYGYDENSSNVDECDQIVEQIDKEFQGEFYINPYGVYGNCAIEDIDVLSNQKDQQIKLKSSISNTRKYLLNPQLRDPVHLPPCADALGLYTLFYNQDFKNAFHISSNSPKWNVCSGINYTKDDRGSYYLYPKLIQAGLRIWKFSGDVFIYQQKKYLLYKKTDAVVPITGTLYWIQKIQNQYNLRTIVPWRAWYMDGTADIRRQNGGNYWKLNGLTFVSVRAAGHMVPTDQPQSARDMFVAFLNDQDLPAI